MNKRKESRPTAKSKLPTEPKTKHPSVVPVNANKRKSATSRSRANPQVQGTEKPELLKINETSQNDKHMEIHHKPDLVHKPKPWKEYLIEGFMIFIAVMMGFIAENVRETITNNEHVRQLTSRLVQDLKVDTAQLNASYLGELKILKSNDSLFAILQQPISSIDKRAMERLIFESHSLWQFHPSAVAIAAIKNELYLKQFSDSEIINYISTYERHIELLRTVQDITLKYQRSFLDPFLQTHFTPENFDAVFNQKLIPNTNMRNLTQESLTELANDLVLIKVNSAELIRDNQMLKTDAMKLLQYAVSEYQSEER